VERVAIQRHFCRELDILCANRLDSRVAGYATGNAGFFNRCRQLSQASFEILADFFRNLLCGFFLELFAPP
jgi:hypothetical protein